METQTMSDTQQNDTIMPEAMAEDATVAQTAKTVEAAPEAVETTTDTDETINTEQAVSALDMLTKDRDEWKDKSYRLAAEMENIKRRTERDVSDARKYGVSKFAGELLAVQDNLERALLVLENSDMEEKTKEAMVEGMKMTSDQMVKAFNSINVKRITCVGEKLNPELHQAVMQVPTTDHEEDTVVQEVQAGYTIADRCLRPAMVAVATKA